ncbi:MAG: NYN domain-containing protein [Desulfobacterales bacterium]
MRIAVFVDGSNYFFMQKDGLKWWIDAEKLLDYLARDGEIVDATYYVGVGAPQEAYQQAFLNRLMDIGYALETKEIKEIFDDVSGEIKKKANLDIEIVLDMFNTIDNYDMAVLVSGDGDFERPLRMLRARGKKFKVVSTKGFIAYELKKVAGMHYVDVNELRSELEYKKE